MHATPKKIAMEQAAIELFAHKGIAATTIKEIARKAAVTEGALYRHYSSKDEMAFQLFDRELIVVREGLLHSLQAGACVEQNLRAIVSYLYTTYQNTPNSLLLVILNFQSLQPTDALNEKNHIYDFIIDYIRHLFEPLPGQQSPEFLSTLITGVMVQPILFHHYNKLPQHPVHYIDAVTQACCRMVGTETRHEN